MKMKGKGNTEQCIYNLLRIIRGEVPFERLKGMNASIIDKPSTTAPALIRSEAQWLAETYEPRAQINDISLDDILSQVGHFGIKVKSEQ